MPSGAGVAGFGGGLTKGLANVLLQHRQSQAEKKSQEEARKDRLFLSMLPTYLENVESPADLETVFTERFPDLFGGTAGKSGGKAKGKAGGGPFDMISHFLGPLIGRKSADTTTAGSVVTPMGNDLPSQGGLSGSLNTLAGALPPGAQPGTEPAGMIPAPPGSPAAAASTVVPPDVAALAAGAPPVAMPVPPTTGAPAAASSTPARRSLFGVPLMSEGEKVTREVTRATERESQLATARVAVARRLLPELQKIDKSVTLEDALRYVAKGELMPDRNGIAFQSIAGEMPDGKGGTKPAFGILDRTTGTYVDANTREPLIGFQPRTSTGSTNLGADREALAREKFGKPAAALTSEEMAQVNADLPAYAQKMALGRGRGTGQAKIETDLKSPIGPTAAAIYNMPPTTTLGELSQVNTLRPEQQEKIASLGQVDQLLDEITTGLSNVYPDVDKGIWGRLQTQFTLGAKKLGADEDLASLDASINAALAQVAQLSGQPGSRLSDRDVELAKSTLAELKPSLFGGDTLRTATARLGVVRRLLDKAKSSVPPKTPGGVAVPGPTTTGAPAPTDKSKTTNTSGAVIKDGKLYVNGQEIG